MSSFDLIDTEGARPVPGTYRQEAVVFNLVDNVLPPALETSSSTLSIMLFPYSILFSFGPVPEG